MTWKRVATAVLLMPVVIALVLWGSTTVVAVAVAVLTAVALWEYFGLGEAIGHRGYRVWTVICAVLLIYAQWTESYAGSGNDRLYCLYCFSLPPTTKFLLRCGCFSLFVLGLTVITIWGKRMLVEALPAAGISSSALLLVAFPLSYAVPLHGFGWMGREFLLFACGITWAGDTVAYFVGRRWGNICWHPSFRRRRLGKGLWGEWRGRWRWRTRSATGSRFRWGICWRWERSGMWRDKWGICWSPHTSGRRG